MKTFVRFLKESTQSLRNRFPEVIRLMGKTGPITQRGEISPRTTQMFVYSAPKTGRDRTGRSVRVNPPKKDLGGPYATYTPSSDGTTPDEIEISNQEQPSQAGSIAHEIAHGMQTAASGMIPSRLSGHIPYTLQPHEIDARSFEAAHLGREHGKSDLSDVFKRAKKGEPLPSEEDLKDSARANYDDVLIDIGQIENAREEPPSRSFSKEKLLKKLKRRVLGGYEHGYRYAVTPATLKSTRRKAEQIRKRKLI
jgi:hypothetical protein